MISKSELKSESKSRSKLELRFKLRSKFNLNSNLLFKFIILSSLALLLCLPILSLSQMEDYNASNIAINIHPDYKSIFPGEDVVSSIKILNLASKNRLDIILHYEIKDVDEKIIYSRQETIAIETQANLVRTFKMSDEIKQGTYDLTVKAIFPDKREAFAKDSFQITRKYYEYLYIGIIIFLVIILFLSFKRLKKQYKLLKLKLKINRIVKKRISKKN